ncbi:hypothetical protein D7B24_004173 [Verticillium nonalfalfae]|uniref:Rhodopsin domain-containing protein n=1 Tax=Verticillium nonalfalfae TaxID=1051616 RepID=A0A3M9YGW3_9PEZI|nr:uncharacterized protein D7B24_004173 [Verticillium nonalfalfae]RNJ58808.1 hypothetical protein D7B24_004173 [Verticillium nonalfalfae]
MGWVRNASPEVEAISQWPLIIGLCVALSFMSITVVSSRLFIRHKARGLAADDYFAGLSMLFALVYSILTVVQTRYGLGLPVLLRPKANLVTYTRVNFAGRPFYQLGISFFKIALLISYLRLLQGTDHKTYRKVVWAIIGFVFCSHLGCTLALIFACDPVDKSWNPLKAGVCLPPGPSFTGYAVVTIVSDIIVTLLPIPVLLKLNIKLEKKLGLIVVFILGIFTTICSVMRYSQINRIQFGDGNSTMLVLWGTIEFNVGNVVSSLPFLAPVFVKKARGYRSKPTSGYGRSGSHVLGGKSGDRYKLSDVGRDKSAFVSANDRSNSEENILSTLPEHSIVKSMTYSVQVDDNAAATSSSSKAAGRLDL